MIRCHRWWQENRWKILTRKIFPCVISSKGASRVLLGAFAGGDFAKAEVNVVDAGSGEIIGSTTIESRDKLASGGPELFTSNHAKAISKFLQGR